MAERRNYLRIEIIVIERVIHGRRSDEPHGRISTGVLRTVLELDIRHDELVAVEDILHGKIPDHGDHPGSQDDSEDENQESQERAEDICNFGFILYGDHPIEVDDEKPDTQEGQEPEENH